MLETLLAEYLGRQRWYAGSEPEKVIITADEQLTDDVRWLLVEPDGSRYQLLLGSVGEGERPEFFDGHDDHLIGVDDGRLWYDALIDARLTIQLLHHVAPEEEVELVRPMGVEQSNTSVVFDDRLVLKLFRRLHEGRNPDVEVTTALARTGFENVAAPLHVWHDQTTDFAVVQPFLAGAAEGWALALTSLRDFYGSDCDDPAECGGDFAFEANRLGQVTARMHLALAETFGTQPADVDDMRAGMRAQLERVDVFADPSGAVLARRVFDALPAGGVAIRVHGDYHLGQVVRTDAGWFVLDFEGEPARPLQERQRASSPLKDVAGMLRSFHYASEFARREAPPGDLPRLEGRPILWEQWNRQNFLEGYLTTEGIETLLPGEPEDMTATLRALAAWELDKAIYEVAYEREYRPDWVQIPEVAIQRLLNG